MDIQESLLIPEQLRIGWQAIKTEDKHLNDFSDIEKSTLSNYTPKESLGMMKVIKPEEVWDIADPSKQILIVDDNYYSSYALGSLLEQYALEVHFAKNGREAADLVKLRNEKIGETYKLIITDL